MNDGIIVYVSMSEIACSDRPQNLKDMTVVGKEGLFLVPHFFSFRGKITAEMLNNPKYSLKLIVCGISDPFLRSHPSCMVSSASLCFLLRCRRIFWNQYFPDIAQTNLSLKSVMKSKNHLL